jgi:hypothetical protein
MGRDPKLSDHAALARSPWSFLANRNFLHKRFLACDSMVGWKCAATALTRGPPPIRLRLCSNGSGPSSDFLAEILAVQIPLFLYVTLPFDHPVPSFSPFTHHTTLPVFLPYLRNLRSVSRESVPAVSSWCAQPLSSVKFSFRTICRKSKLFMGGICTLAFETQDWGFVSFLVCIVVLLMHYSFGYLFCFWFSLLLLEWEYCAVFFNPDWDVFV